MPPIIAGWKPSADDEALSPAGMALVLWVFYSMFGRVLTRYIGALREILAAVDQTVTRVTEIASVRTR